MKKFKIVLLIIISYTIFIFNVYLSLSIGQLPIFNRFRNVSSFIGFLVINLLISYVQNIVDNAFVNIEAIDNINYAINSVTSIVSKGLNVAIIINIIIILVLFFATSYILNKKLNLE